MDIQDCPADAASTQKATDEEPEMTDDWPNARAPYERPAETENNTARWQQALDAALGDGSLQWVGTDDPDIYRLAGACPRCGHNTEQTVEINYIRGLDEVAEKVRFNLDCACWRKHSEGAKDHDNCGWGGPLAVQADAPGGQA